MKQMINRILHKLRRRQTGSATVEAVVSFTGFLFVIFTILNIVNLCRAQMLVSNAVDTVAKELTQYSYFYQISGLHKFDQEIQAIGEEKAISLNNVASSVGDLYNVLGTSVSSSEEEMRGLHNSLAQGNLSSDGVQATLLSLDTNVTNVNASIEVMEAQIGDVIDNPVTYLKSIVAVAGSQGLETLKSQAIAAPLAKSLLVKHFGNNRTEADATLERLGVVDGLDGMIFTRSTIFEEHHPDEIHLVVYYKVKVVQLFKWADFEATICKEARARAWLGGDDVQALAKPPEVVQGNTAGDQTGGTVETPPTEGEEEEGSEDEEESDSHPEDTDLEKYLADIDPRIINDIQLCYDTSNWTKEQWQDAVTAYVLLMMASNPTATPTPVATATPTPAATATPAPIIIRMVNDSSDKEFMQNASMLKENLPDWARDRKNYGYCEASIEGLDKSQYYAHSSISSELDSGEAKGISYRKESPYTAISVNNQNEIVAEGEKWKRDTDAEYKILADITSRLGDNFNATGSIKLYTDFSPCKSCEKVITQFMQRYPNISVEVVYTKKYGK